MMFDCVCWFSGSDSFMPTLDVLRQQTFIQGSANLPQLRNIVFFHISFYFYVVIIVCNGCLCLTELDILQAEIESEPKQIQLALLFFGKPVDSTSLLTNTHRMARFT